MKQDMHPGVRRWLERIDPVQSVFDTVSMSAGATQEELGDILHSVCRATTDLLAGRPDASEILASKAPRSPESEDLWRRLVQRHRRESASRWS